MLKELENLTQEQKKPGHGFTVLHPEKGLMVRLPR